MEITNVIISNSFFDFIFKNSKLSFLLTTTGFIFTIIVGMIFYSFQKTKKGKIRVAIFSNILFALYFSMFPVIVFSNIYDWHWGYDASDTSYNIYDGRTEKYIVEYNNLNSQKIMTTQEIINEIYNQRYFKDRKEKISKVVIYIKGKENAKLIKQILQMNNNTNFIKENEQKEKEKEQEENNKFSNETHTVNIKK